MAQSRQVVITGASRGLGRAMAREFARQGHRVAGCGRTADAMRELEAELGEDNRFAVVDVTDDRAVAHWAHAVIKTNGAPDLLVNNAALINPGAELWRLSAAEVDPVIDVNIKGVANVIRHFVPTMVERGSGVIVNFSSGWGRSTSRDVSPYCATKWAIEGLTQAMAQELPEGMAAVPLNPGVIDTAMLRSCFGEGAGSYPDPEEWARTAVPFILQLGSRDNGRPATAP